MTTLEENKALACRNALTADAIVVELKSGRGRLLDIAAGVQQCFGRISQEAISSIASGLGMHPVEVVEAVSFYAFFDQAPRGRNRIRLSKTPISVMKGAISVLGTRAQIRTLQYNL